MNSGKIIRFFSTLKPNDTPFSRKRDSMFYIKTIQLNPTPSLKSIYRKFIKQSLRFYKTGNQYIGEYLFRLLQAKKQSLKEAQKNLVEINELLDEIKTLNAKQTNNHEKQEILQKISQDKKASPLFSKLKKQSNPKVIESHEIRLSLQKQNRERILTQKMLDDFECIHHMSNILEDSMNLQNEMDFRTKQQSKLVRLSFNLSQFFTPILGIRQGYQSLVLLGCLEDDMEYEVLSDKDKQFVKDVLIKVCGPKKLNHLRYRSAIDYLKDINAVINEVKITRIEIAKKAKKPSQKKNDEKSATESAFIEEEIKAETQQNDDQQQEQKAQNEWRLMSIECRNQAVRNILNQRKQKTSSDKQSTKKIKLSRQLKKSLIFQILHKSQKTPNILKPNQKLQQEIYQLIRRLFKLTDEQNTSIDSGQHKKEKMKYKLLQDVIIENQFIDEFINQKKIIIV